MRKPIRFIPDDTKIAFMRLSRFGFFFSGILCVASVLAFVFIGLTYGVDFKGGTVLVIRTEQAADLDALRTTINGLGLGEAELQEFGSPREVQIRLPTIEGGDAAQQAVIVKIKEALGPKVEYLSVDVVGPKVSSELTQQGIMAVVIAIIGILLYIWFRFEWQFCLGTVVSILHDVMLSIGLFCIIGLEFNLQIIAAILTIIGYSLNDTVIVFDRIREFMRKYKTMQFADLIDFSINSVLPRTLITAVSTLLALTSLYIFGGEVLRGFSLAMIWGVLIGTYSSIFIAAPILILLGAKREALTRAADPKMQPVPARP
ncbi:hypothetical protein BH10PSE7_BH10PSE7_10050 [soil metagenome]